MLNDNSHSFFDRAIASSSDLIDEQYETKVFGSSVTDKKDLI